MLLMLIGPLLLWAVFFTLFYAAQTVGCQSGWDSVFWGNISLLRAVIVSMLLFAMVASAGIYMVVKQSRAFSAGISRIGRYCAIASVVSTILVFPGVFWLQLC